MVNFINIGKITITFIGALITFYKVILWECWLNIKWNVIEWRKRKLLSSNGIAIINAKQPIFLTPGEHIKITPYRSSNDS